MSSPSPNEEFSGDGIPDNIQHIIEAKIRRASGYVAPSENLRPKTLQAARECWDDKCSNRTFYKLMFSVSLGLVMVVYAIQGLSMLSYSIEPLPSEAIEREAHRTSYEQHISVDWALQEEYARYRDEQVQRFDASVFERDSTRPSK
ncbi:MAG: hypothetical protein ABL921_30545 [Pirellula sp.]